MAIKLVQVKPLTFMAGNGGTWLSPSAAQSDQFGNGWVEDRTADSTHYRETFPAFEQQDDYIMRIKLLALDDIPFDIPRKGHQLAGPGMQRQIKIPIRDIEQLPTFYKLVTVPG